jgi:hypothetical protein
MMIQTHFSPHMLHYFTSRSLLKTVFLSFAVLVPAMGQQEAARQDEKKDKARLRLICISCLETDQQVTIASRNEKGEWLELGKAGLRSSFISDWLPAKPGELHLALPEGDGLKSICRFNYPADSKNALVVLIADPEKKDYKAGVFDPDKMGFAKGSVLAINFSSRPGILVMGSKKVLLESGGKSVIKPTLEKNGMYRMLVAYEDTDRKPVPCYDRYVQGNPDSRDLLFLIPDRTVGLKVFSLPIFGAFN